jgi:hypothetical protein
VHPKMTCADVVKRFTELGYFKADSAPSSRALKMAIRRFQRFNGLDETGVIDDQTVAALLTPMRCGSPDMLVSDSGCRWPMDKMAVVTYHTQLRLPGISTSQAHAVYDAACRQWESVCGIRFKRIATAGKANIAAKSGLGQTAFLDGRGGTLGWSYMPCGAQPTTKVPQMYDQAERWSSRMLLAVACHEIGHAIGLPHGKPGQLMAAYYNADVTAPQTEDIAQAAKLYGAPQRLQQQQAAHVVQIARPTTIEIRDATDDSLITTLFLP